MENYQFIGIISNITNLYFVSSSRSFIEDNWIYPDGSSGKVVDLSLELIFGRMKLTPNMWATQPLVTWWKWNMDEIFVLKFHLSYVHKYTTFLKISPCAKNAKFVTDFLILKANPPFYEVNQ